MDSIFKKENLLRSIVLGTTLLLGATGIYFYSRPYTYVVRGEAAIVCDNQKMYPALPNDIQEVDGLSAYIESGYSDPDIERTDLKVRKLCAYGVLHDFVPFRGAPENRNYSVRLGNSVPSLDISQNSEVTLSHE